MLVSIWAQVLGIRQVGANDNFFELGGDSLSATRVISRILIDFNANIPIKEIFNKSTIGDIAAKIDETIQLI